LAGPGEPLAGTRALDVLNEVHRRRPQLIKCISTNGLKLEESIDGLQSAGIRTVTVTVNAVDPLVGMKIYRWVSYGNKMLEGGGWRPVAD